MSYEYRLAVGWFLQPMGFIKQAMPIRDLGLQMQREIARTEPAKIVLKPAQP
jgi:hypothetical protein